MPRSARDSDEEIDVKTGRKTRALTETVVDSPLRRSTRNKANAKQNESSPDSPLSDASNVSNTQITRVTRRRTIAMDTVAATENHRTLRSRMNSISSDVSEIAELDIGTPKKRTASNASSDAISKMNNRRSKRLTRAGSEASASPVTRITRTTRATSVEPDAHTGNKLSDRFNREQTGTPSKTRRRTLVLPSEATVMEEKEDNLKVPVVSLDRTLPNLKEVKELESNDSPNSAQRKESLSGSRDTNDTRNNSGNEKSMEDDSSVKGPHDHPPENISSNSFEDVKRNALFEDKNMLNNENNVLENTEKLLINTKKQTESPVHNESQRLSQYENEGTFKAVGLKHEDLLNKSVEKLRDNNNKENLTANVQNYSESTDDTTFNILQSPKSVSTIGMNVSKLTNEVCKSPCTETNLTPKRRHSKELSVIFDEDFSGEVVSNTNASINSVIEKMDISVNERDISDDAKKLVVSTEAESVVDCSFSESSDDNVSSKTSPNANQDVSTEIMECTEDVKVDVDSSTQVNTPSNHESDKTHEKERNEDENIKMNASSVEINMDENMESVKNTTSENIVKGDKADLTDENVDSNKAEDTDEKDIEMNDVGAHSFTDVTNIEPAKSSGGTANIDIQQSASEHEDMHSLQNTDETNNLHYNTYTSTESSDALTSPKDSPFTKSNDDNVINMIKSNQSSTVTETPRESIEEAPEGEEQSEKVSVLDSSLTLKKQRVNEIESDEKYSDAKEETSKEVHKSMKIDDNDSDTNAASLFQDIPATEWKEKNANADINSVHSLSTEKLENESEGECDLVLVDRDAWLAAESMKTEQEKETFDYDSDDTVLLKTKKDLEKSRNEEKLAKDESEDECKLNVSKNKISGSKKRKSVEYKAGSNEDINGDLEDSEDIAENMEEEATNVDKNKSVVKDSSKHSTPRCNLSLRKSVGEKSLSEPHKAVENDVNVSLNKSKSFEDVSEKRKSLGRSLLETSKPDETNETESAKRRSSLNKSNLIDTEKSETETESNGHTVATSAKKKERKQSLNSSMKKKMKPQQLDTNSTDEFDDELKENAVHGDRDSVTKKKFTRNYSTVANIGSESDESKNISDSDDSRNKTVKLPKFLFGGSSDSDSDGRDESNQSMDSDIEKEYNLHGKSISKFSDDDVPGDECRASETESSDPDDDGSDLADFVVNDDEVEEEDDDDDENEEEDGGDDENEEEDDKDAENEELVDVEELEDQSDDEVEMQEDKKMQVEEEMEAEEEIDEEASPEEDQSEDSKENSVEKSTSKVLNTSSEERKKPNKFEDLNSSQITRSDKKKKNHQRDVSQSERSEKETSLADISLSIFESTKTKQKRASGEFTVEDIEQPLNESQRVLNKKLHKLSKSIECSTPKINSSKREKFNISMQMSNTSFEETRKKLKTKASEVKEDEIPEKEQSKNMTLGEGYTSKKLNKIKSNDNVMHRSLPSELIELVSKTNLSRSMSSKVVELNKTTFVPDSETPTTRYLKKQKLNESAPVLKLDTKFKKLKEINGGSDQNDQLEDESGSPNEESTEATKSVDDSLKAKILQVADSILKKDQQKKRKKRKQPIVERNKTILPEDDIHENEDSGTAKENENTVSNVSTDNNTETVPSDKKKRKKKKKTHNIVPVKEGPSEEATETKSVSNDKKVHIEGKKKKKKEKVVEAVSRSANTNEDPKVAKKKKKVLGALSGENVSAEQLPKKKQKKQQLLSKDIVPQDEDASRKILPKKKKKLQSEDNVLQEEEVSDKKVPKKKKKLSKETSQDERILIEKLPKKKQKLLESEKGNVKRATSNKSKGLSNAASDSHEGLETVVFSNVRNEALKVSKRTADSNEAPKETKKKKQKVRTERSQNEGEVKIKKIESKNQATKSIKRLSDEVLENLSDVPMKPLKRRKIAKVEDISLSSRSTPSSNTKEIKNVFVEEDFTTLPSTSGSTTAFSVIDLRKMKKKKKHTEMISFKQKMISRKSRQPVSAYLMYLEKQKASGKDKFCSRPY